MRALQRGFTLIELLVVIIILGILGMLGIAAFAVPRFMRLETQARIASLDSLAGTLQSAASAAHSVYLARGTPPNPVAIDGRVITFVNGYPNAATIQNLLAQGTVTASNLAGAFTSNGNGTFTFNGAPTPADCAVTYTPPAVQDIGPSVVTVPAGLGGTAGGKQMAGGC